MSYKNGNCECLMRQMERVNTITADKVGGSMDAPFYCQWEMQVK